MDYAVISQDHGYLLSKRDNVVVGGGGTNVLSWLGSGYIDINFVLYLILYIQFYYVFWRRQQRIVKHIIHFLKYEYIYWIYI